MSIPEYPYRWRFVCLSKGFSMIPGGQIVREVYISSKEESFQFKLKRKTNLWKLSDGLYWYLYFLFAEHKRNRFQGVFEGVVRDQIRSRVSELCGTCRSVSKECGFSYAAKPYVLIRSSFAYATCTNVKWNHCLALLCLTRAQLSLSFLLIN